MGVDQATSFLQQRYGDAVRDVSALTGGSWSRAFSFDVDDERLVARFGQHREDFAADRRAMSYAGPALPVPAVLEIGEALGGCYAISQRYDGVFLEDVTREQFHRLQPALLAMLNAMCAVQPDRTGPAPSWRDWLVASLAERPDARTGAWRAQVQEVPWLESLFTEAQIEMERLLPHCPEELHLLHRDLLHRNVLVDVDNARLTAVFDWGCSVWGDPLYELAWFTFWAPWHPGIAGDELVRSVRAEYEKRGEDTTHFEQRMACYELHIALEHLGYMTFTGEDEARAQVAERTRSILASLPGT